MPVHVESREYAQARLDRIVQRYRYHYSSSYYVSRAFSSATRRMTNLTKLRMWAEVLQAAGYDNAANYVYNRIEGLQDGSVPTPRRRRLARSLVPAYVPIAPLREYTPATVSFVNYKFTPEIEVR